MNKQDIDHRIEQFSAQADRDEALARVLLGNAAEKREMVETMKQMREENERLREQQLNVKVEIGTLNGNYIENTNDLTICQPSSINSTEPTSNTSEPTSKTPIHRLSSV